MRYVLSLIYLPFLYHLGLFSGYTLFTPVEIQYVLLQCVYMYVNVLWNDNCKSITYCNGTLITDIKTIILIISIV